METDGPYRTLRSAAHELDKAIKRKRTAQMRAIEAAAEVKRVQAAYNDALAAVQEALPLRQAATAGEVAPLSWS